MKKQLSVAMANYNHARYLPEAIEAVLAQSYQPMEFIIIDDGSTDNSIDIIESYAKKHPIIRFYRHEKNEGILVSANRLLELAQGEYIYCTAADDKILPGFFEKSMQCLERHPQAALCCSDPAYFDNAGPIEARAFCLSQQPTYLTAETLVKVIRKENFIVGGHTTIARLEAIKEAGGWRKDLKWHCDWFTMHVMAFRYGACYIPEFLACQRDMHASYSRKGLRDIKEQQKVIESILYAITQDCYQDVRDAFADSAIFSAFGTEALKLIFTDPRFRGFRTSRLVLNVVKRNLKQVLGSISPQFVKKTYRRWRDSPRPFILKRKCYDNKSLSR